MLQDVIVLSPEGMFTSNAIPLPKMVNIFCAATNAACEQILKQIEADEAIEQKDKEKYKKEIFDEMNHAFSKCLDICFPDEVLHPELTEEVLHKVLDKETEFVAAKAKHKKPIAPTPVVE